MKENTPSPAPDRDPNEAESSSGPVPKKLVTCPKCKGSGRIRNFYGRPGRGRGKGCTKYSLPEVSRCPACRGTGAVKADLVHQEVWDVMFPPSTSGPLSEKPNGE